MIQCVDTYESSFATILPAHLTRFADVCVVCGKGLVTAWATGAHHACICPECLSGLYPRASGVRLGERRGALAATRYER